MNKTKDTWDLKFGDPINDGKYAYLGKDKAHPGMHLCWDLENESIFSTTFKYAKIETVPRKYPNFESWMEYINSQVKRKQ